MSHTQTTCYLCVCEWASVCVCVYKEAPKPPTAHTSFRDDREWDTRWSSCSDKFLTSPKRKQGEIWSKEPVFCSEGGRIILNEGRFGSSYLKDTRVWMWTQCRMHNQNPPSLSRVKITVRAKDFKWFKWWFWYIQLPKSQTSSRNKKSFRSDFNRIRSLIYEFLDSGGVERKTLKPEWGRNVWSSQSNLHSLGIKM